MRRFVIAAALVCAAGAAQAQIEVRIASHVSDKAPLHQQSVMFAERVDALLPGQFDFKIFPGGQLGKEGALIDNAQLGAIEMINIASGILKTDPKLGIFDLPFLFDDRAHVIRVMEDGGLKRDIVARIEDKAGVKVVGVYENGFRHVINSVRAIAEPADLADMKVRVSGGKFRQGVFASLGATPTAVSWSETFTAMQTGVVDGAEAAIYGFYGQRHYEVQKHLSLTSHVYTPSFLLASESFWSGLTDEQRKVFAQVGESMTRDAYAGAAELETRYLAVMERADIAVNAADLPAFQEKTRSVYGDYVAAHGDDWVQRVNAAR